MESESVTVPQIILPLPDGTMQQGIRAAPSP